VTERWRKKLEGIDRVGPGDDVYERAKAGPSLPEPQSPMQRTSTRVVTAIVAFVVFALAISVFAIPALRLGNKESFVPGGDQLQPLWPWNSIDAVQAWRGDPQPIGATSVDHFSSPEEVAAAFGRDVLGWTEVYPHEEGTMYPCLPRSDLIGIVSPSAGTGITAAPGTIDACPVAYGGGSVPPTIALSGSTSAAPAFRTFDLSTCPPNAACDYAAPGPPSIKVVVYQPLGGEGPWAVLEAKTDYVSISLDPGTQVRDGSTAYAGGSIPTGEHAVLGYHATADGCGEHSDTTAFEVGTDAASDRTSGGLSFAYSRGQLQFTLPPQGDACRAQVGYVFLAITDQGLATTDPLGGIPVTTGVLGFAAVPVSFLFMSQDAGSPPPSSTLSPSPIATPAHGYTDPLGWTIDVPDGWVTTKIDGSGGAATYEGAAFGSARPLFEPGGPEYLGAQPGEVVLELYHAERSTGSETPTDDSVYPLNFKELAPNGSSYSLDINGDGTSFTLVVHMGDGAPSPEQQQILEEMISSIHFQPWTPGEERNGWLALGPTTDDDQRQQDAKISWQNCDKTGCYVLVYGDYGPGGQGPYVLGPIQPCGEGENMTADPTSTYYPIVLECPDGTTQAWGAPGEPAPTNSRVYGSPLNVWPVIRAWDGSLLTSVTDQSS
jgi:hypothetical protein